MHKGVTSGPSGRTDSRTRPRHEHDRFPHRAVPLSSLADRDRRRRRLPGHGRRSGRRAVARLRAQAELLRPRRRHRTERRGAAAALRASAGALRRRQVGQGQRVLRRRQYPHARQGDAQPQGELLQVHQRDAARHGRRQRKLAPDLHERGQRLLRRRRLRAGACDRPHHADRRPPLDRVAAGDAAARRAARHRRAHPRHRQAQGAARPRRRVLLHRRGPARRQGARLAAGRRGGAAVEMGRGGARPRARSGAALRPARPAPRASR